MAAVAKCNVCMDEFEKEGEKIPKLLPCTHTVCLWCLSQFRGLGIRCPECRAHHPIPKGGPKSFPTNRYVLEILDLMSGNSKKGTVKIKDDGIECEEHKKPCVMICLEKNCWKLLCPKCPAQQHQEHNLVGLGECMGNVAEFQHIKAELSQELNKLNSYQNILKRGKNEVLRKRDDAQRAVDKKADEMKRAIDASATELKREIRRKCADETEKVNEVILDVDRWSLIGSKIKDEIEDHPKATVTDTVKHIVGIQKEFADFMESSQREISDEVSYDAVEFNDSENQVISIGEMSTCPVVVGKDQVDVLTPVMELQDEEIASIFRRVLPFSDETN